MSSYFSLCTKKEFCGKRSGQKGKDRKQNYKHCQLKAKDLCLLFWNTKFPFPPSSVLLIFCVHLRISTNSCSLSSSIKLLVLMAFLLLYMLKSTTPSIGYLFSRIFNSSLQTGKLLSEWEKNLNYI